jgi:hypothetical protein
VQQSQTQTRNLWRPAAMGGLLMAAIGFYEPLKDLYLKVYDPDYKGVVSVTMAQEQLELADRNAECFLTMKRSKVQLSNTVSISYGACPNNNIHIGVYPAKQPAYQRWIEPNRHEEAGRTAGLFPAAYAGFAGSAPSEPAGTELDVIKAQTEMKTVCQQFEGGDRRKVVRISDEGGKCVFERVNLLTGVIEVREDAVCDAKCPDEAKKYR